ncbi:MAG TPA: lysophospholipid acyltransferase family protein [Actinomycetes bacterium]|nr:lysophospholipid acyltransferase family protein [Actinomycetes bacterium]
MRGEESPGAAYSFARTVLRPLLRASTARLWQGSEHIPREGGCVIVANHVSHSDPIPIGDFIDSAGRRPRFLGKAELFDTPGLGALLRSAGQIPVHRQSAQAGAALEAAVEGVRRGHCVVIYPEGTITRDPDMWPMVGKTGAARVWWETRCPVIPVAQWGPQDLLAPYAKVPRLWPRPVMRVKAGPPLELPTTEPPDFRALTARIMAAIAGLLGDLRDEMPPPSAYDPDRSHLPRTGNPQRHDDGSA